MINIIVAQFQTFRHRLFQLFPYRAGATMDLIDAVSAMTTADSVVKLSLSDLFRRTYSSLTDVLSSLFRTNLKTQPTDQDKQKQAFKVTQLLAEKCAPNPSEQRYVLFAIDCTANPRIYASKVDDRTSVHAPMLRTVLKIGSLVSTSGLMSSKSRESGAIGNFFDYQLQTVRYDEVALRSMVKNYCFKTHLNPI